MMAGQYRQTSQRSRGIQFGQRTQRDVDIADRGNRTGERTAFSVSTYRDQHGHFVGLGPKKSRPQRLAEERDAEHFEPRARRGHPYDIPHAFGNPHVGRGGRFGADHRFHPGQRLGDSGHIEFRRKATAEQRRRGQR